MLKHLVRGRLGWIIVHLIAIICIIWLGSVISF